MSSHDPEQIRLQKQFSHEIPRALKNSRNAKTWFYKVETSMDEKFANYFVKHGICLWINALLCFNDSYLKAYLLRF